MGWISVLDVLVPKGKGGGEGSATVGKKHYPHTKKSRTSQYGNIIMHSKQDKKNSTPGQRDCTHLVLKYKSKSEKKKQNTERPHSFLCREPIINIPYIH